MIKFHQKDTKYVVKTMDYAAIKEFGVLVFNYSIDNATGSTILNARFDTKEDFLRILVRNSQCKKTKIPIVHFPFSLIFPPSQNRTRKSETMTQISVNLCKLSRGFSNPFFKHIFAFGMNQTKFFGQCPVPKGVYEVKNISFASIVLPMPSLQLHIRLNMFVFLRNRKGKKPLAYIDSYSQYDFSL